MIGGLKKGNRVVRLSESIAVKYGFNVTESDAATQDFAYYHVDPGIVRVPRVYRFLSGYHKAELAKGLSIHGIYLHDLMLISNSCTLWILKMEGRGYCTIRYLRLTSMDCVVFM
jgi:hypothetical protein